MASGARFTKTSTTMLHPILVLACILLLFTITSEAKFIDNLSYDELSSVLRTGPTMLVFTVSWCPHCQEVLPEIGLLAKAVKKNDGITVARVDGDAEPAILTKFAVESFPTFLYFPPGYDLKENSGPEEFTDYRWAELMAEFVNNETATDTVIMKPRERFLKWRKKVPYNKGKQPRKIREKIETPTPHPEGLDPIIGMDQDKVRDPVLLDTSNFDDLVMNQTEGVAVYFYTKDDFNQRAFLIEWRQAASAYTPNDHVTLAMINIENGDNEQIAKRYNIEDTPTIAYFPKCTMAHRNLSIEECKKPSFCEECPDTDKILDFISNAMISESGVGAGGDDGEVVTLTTEEYEKMLKEGKIIPLNQSEGFIDGPAQVVEPVKEGEEISEEEYQRLIREGHILPDEITDDDGDTAKELIADEGEKIQQDDTNTEKEEL